MQNYQIRKQKNTCTYNSTTKEDIFIELLEHYHHRFQLGFTIPKPLAHRRYLCRHTLHWVRYLDDTIVTWNTLAGTFPPCVFSTLIFVHLCLQRMDHIYDSPLELEVTHHMSKILDSKIQLRITHSKSHKTFMFVTEIKTTPINILNFLLLLDLCTLYQTAQYEQCVTYNLFKNSFWNDLHKQPPCYKITINGNNIPDPESIVAYNPSKWRHNRYSGNRIYVTIKQLTIELHVIMNN